MKENDDFLFRLCLCLFLCCIGLFTALVVCSCSSTASVEIVRSAL